MTTPVSTYRAGPYAGNGVATVFAFDFKVFAKDDIRVVLAVVATGVEADLVLDSDYTVTLNPNQNADPGGSVTYNPSGTPMAATHTLTIVSNLAIEQPLDITNGGGFFPQTQEDAFDRAVILIGQQQEQLDRSLTLPVSAASGVSTELPAPEASTFIGWNALGTALVNYVGLASAAVSAAMAAFVGSATKADARTELDVYSRAQVDATACPVVDTTAIVKGSVDATKLLRFEVDGFTTATTRVLTAPNFDGTIATLDGAETFTNKTLTSPTMIGPNMDQVTGGAVASQAEQETGTATNKIVTPGRQHLNPSALKFWGKCGVAGDLASPSYNITSVGDTGTGLVTVTIDNDFSSGNYAIITDTLDSQNNNFGCHPDNTVGQGAGSFRITNINMATAANVDPANAYFFMGAGDQ